MRTVALTVLAAVVGVLGFGTLGARTWRVERRAVIAAAPSAVSPAILELARWSEWCVWTKARDPLARLTLSGPPDGEGATRQWLGPRVGTGRATVLRVDPVGAIDVEAELEHGRAQAKVRIAWTAAPGGTEVRWLDEGELPAPLGAWFLRDYEARLGADVDASLAALGAVADVGARAP